MSVSYRSPCLCSFTDISVGWVYLNKMSFSSGENNKFMLSRFTFYYIFLMWVFTECKR